MGRKGVVRKAVPSTVRYPEFTTRESARALYELLTDDDARGKDFIMNSEYQGFLPCHICGVKGYHVNGHLA